MRGVRERVGKEIAPRGDGNNNTNYCSFNNIPVDKEIAPRGDGN